MVYRQCCVLIGWATARLDSETIRSWGIIVNYQWRIVRGRGRGAYYLSSPEKGEGGLIEDLRYLPHHPMCHNNLKRLNWLCWAIRRCIIKRSDTPRTWRPTTLHNLTDVLKRFRQVPIAFMADVGLMFHQFRVVIYHCHALSDFFGRCGYMAGNRSRFSWH